MEPDLKFGRGYLEALLKAINNVLTDRIMNKLKIALVKQEVYQDLYVCPVTEKDPGQILFSSMGRVGPIAL